MLVSVHCDNSSWVGWVKDILKQTGAEMSTPLDRQAPTAENGMHFPAIRSQRANDQKLPIRAHVPVKAGSRLGPVVLSL